MIPQPNFFGVLEDVDALTDWAHARKALVIVADCRIPAPNSAFEMVAGDGAAALLIASERARFADTHARLNVLPGWGLTALLPRAVGVRKAREMSMTGSLSTAMRCGLPETARLSKSEKQIGRAHV